MSQFSWSSVKGYVGHVFSESIFANFFLYSGSSIRSIHSPLGCEIWISFKYMMSMCNTSSVLYICCTCSSYNNSSDSKITLLNVNFVPRLWNLKCFYSKHQQSEAYLISNGGGSLNRKDKHFCATFDVLFGTQMKIHNQN